MNRAGTTIPAVHQSLAGGIGATFSHTVVYGPLLLGAAVALVAGLVSFLSPCVLPLVPGYLSYVTGLTGNDVAGRPGAGRRMRLGAGRSRTFLGAALFVLGFTVVFVSYGALFGGLGRLLLLHQTLITTVLGAVTIALGLAFMGVLPGFAREWRVHRRPAAGLVGAPLLGFLFGLGWTPCIGPTLAAVETLAAAQASAGRGALLSLAYCIGLGVPFVVAAFGFRFVIGAFGVVRRHAAWVTRIGGAFLVVLGILVVGGWWSEIMNYARDYTSIHAGVGGSV